MTQVAQRETSTAGQARDLRKEFLIVSGAKAEAFTESAKFTLVEVPGVKSLVLKDENAVSLIQAFENGDVLACNSDGIRGTVMHLKGNTLETTQGIIDTFSGYTQAPVVTALEQKTDSALAARAVQVIRSDINGVIALACK